MVDTNLKTELQSRMAIWGDILDDAPGRLSKIAQRRLRAVWVNRRVFALDLGVCALAVCLAFVLRLGIYNDAARFEPLLLLAPISMLAGALVYPTLGLYRQHVMSTSLRDAIQITWAAAIMVSLVVVVWTLFRSLSEVPRTAFIIQFLLAVPMHGAVRIYARRADLIVFNKASAKPEALDVLMVGTGTSCDLFLRASQRDPDAIYRPIGIIDDASETRGLFFHNVPILGSIRDIEDVLTRLVEEGPLPRQIILTEPTTHFDINAVTTLHHWAETRGIGVSKLPGLCELKGLSNDGLGDANADFNLTNLLDRPQKVIDESRLRRMATGRRVLVTGAGGSIGSELVRQIASLEPSELILIENSEYNLYAIDMDLQQYFPDVPRTAYMSNIRDRTRIRSIFEEHRPELVFHAAALKHVPMVELNPCEGALTNVIGSRNIADAAYDYGALAFVQVSTDKAVNTTNVMGATKRVAEFYCQALDRRACREGVKTRFMTVRFGNVLGSSGSLIPLFQKQIAQGGPLTITDPRMERFFMTIREAVELTLLASANGLEDSTDAGQIFVLDMGQPIRIIDLAERMIRLAGLTKGKDIDIDIVGIRPGEKLFEELFDKNERPMDCGMDGVQAAMPTGVALNDLRAGIIQLEVFSRVGDAKSVLNVLSSLVPGYNEDGGPEDQGMSKVVNGLDQLHPSRWPTFQPANKDLALVVPSNE